MKEFFLTSTFPYWLLLILSLASVGYAYFITKDYYIPIVGYDEEDSSYDYLKPISRNTVIVLSAIMLAVAIAVIALYGGIGGKAFWWATSKDLSYWQKLIRVIPLLVFFAAQGLAPFMYKRLMEVYFDKGELSIKSQFISLVVIVPVALILVYVIGGFFLDSNTQSICFYAITGVGLAAAAIYAVKNNVSSIGGKAGILYTVTSFVLCASTLITLLYLIVAFISLIAEMGPVIAVLIGIKILFGKNFSNAMLNRDSAGRYIANDGSRHSTQSARDSRNSQLNANRNK